MRKAPLLYPAVASVLAAATSSAAAQGAASSDDVVLSEVVVTAQRFTESAQKTSLAIEVLSPDQLQGVADVRQLQTVTPGVSLAPAGNVVQTYIRGVGSWNATNQQEAAVAYNVDGVYLSTTTMISPQLFDLERVEVLKGPQGTLYGRNASGGAINLIATGAQLEELGGYAEIEGGDYDLRRVSAAVNLPASDKLAFRLAGQDVSHEGYLSDGTDDQDVSALRLRALWQPSDAIILHGGVDASWTDATGAGTSLNPNPTNVDWIGGTDPRAQAVFPLHSVPPNPPPHLKNDAWGAHVELDAELGFGTLTLLPAYRAEKLRSASYVPGYGYGEDTHTKQKTFEARLSNRTDTLRWVVGAYYYKNDQNMRTTVRFDAIQFSTVSGVAAETEAYAGFGEATFSITDAFRTIVGVRYTHENSTIGGPNNSIAYGSQIPNGPFLPNTPAFDPIAEPGDYVVDSSTSGHATTWKGGFEFDVTDDSMLFATASKGFKGGGNYFDRIPDASFKPEYVTAVELGSRNRFLDDALQVNVEVFHWKLDDQQIPYVGYNSLLLPTFLTANAGQATMYGANADVTWRATRSDTLRIAAEYLNSEYDSFVREVPTFSVLGFPFAPVTDCEVLDYNPANPASTSRIDCKGQQMIRAPEWSGLVRYDHVFELGGAGDITFGANLTYASRREIDIAYTDQTHDGAYQLVDASLTYNSPSRTWVLSGWVHNITEERVMTGGSQNFPGFFRPSLLPPRTWGASFRYNF